MRTTARRPPPTVGVLACWLAFLVGACGAGPTSAPTAAPTSTPGATATTSPTPTPDVTATPPPPTEVPTATASPPPLTCGETIRRPGTVPLARISGFEVANEAGLGRITITFRAEGNVAAVPEVQVRPADPPFTRDPSGLPLDVPGRGFVAIILLGGTALDANFDPTFEGPVDVDLEGSPIQSVRRAGDFEAVSTFIVGLDGSPCARVLPPDGTSRLVVELATE